MRSTGPGSDNWEVEEALDVEWVHAMAPGARIIIVENNTQSLTDLMAGVATAAGQPGVSVDPFREASTGPVSSEEPNTELKVEASDAYFADEDCTASCENGLAVPVLASALAAASVVLGGRVGEESPALS
jgi:subtilase family serine protease